MCVCTIHVLVCRLHILVHISEHSSTGYIEMAVVIRCQVCTLAFSHSISSHLRLYHQKLGLVEKWVISTMGKTKWFPEFFFFRIHESHNPEHMELGRVWWRAGNRHIKVCVNISLFVKPQKTTLAHTLHTRNLVKRLSLWLITNVVCSLYKWEDVCSCNTLMESLTHV